MVLNRSEIEVGSTKSMLVIHNDPLILLSPTPNSACFRRLCILGLLFVMEELVLEESKTEISGIQGNNWTERATSAAGLQEKSLNVGHTAVEQSGSGP